MAYPMPSRSAEDIVRALYDEQSTVRTLFPPEIGGPHLQPVLTEVTATAADAYEMPKGTVRVEEENMGDADLYPTPTPSCLAPAQGGGLEARESDGHHIPPPEHDLTTESSAQMGSAGQATIELGHTGRPTPAFETGRARPDHCVPLFQSPNPMMVDSEGMSGGRALAHLPHAWETEKGEALAPLHPWERH